MGNMDNADFYSLCFLFSWKEIASRQIENKEKEPTISSSGFPYHFKPH